MSSAGEGRTSVPIVRQSPRSWAQSSRTGHTLQLKVYIRENLCRQLNVNELDMWHAVKRSQNDIAKRGITVMTESEKTSRWVMRVALSPGSRRGGWHGVWSPWHSYWCCCFVVQQCPTLCDPMDCACRPLCPWDCLGVDGDFTGYKSKLPTTPSFIC